MFIIYNVGSRYEHYFPMRNFDWSQQQDFCIRNQSFKRMDVTIRCAQSGVEADPLRSQVQCFWSLTRVVTNGTLLSGPGSVFCGNSSCFICQFRGKCPPDGLSRIGRSEPSERMPVASEMSRDGWMIWMIWMIRMRSSGGIWKMKTGLRISLLCRYRAAVLLPVRAAHHSVDACDPGFAIVAKFTDFSSTGHCQYIPSVCLHISPYFTTFLWPSFSRSD